MQIVERTLGNNQDFSTWQENRINWNAQAGNRTDGAPFAIDRVENSEVALQGQRIRLFRVTYNASTTSEKLVQA